VSAEWSVLIKSTATSAHVPHVSDVLRFRLIDLLPGTDKWFQYPAASGRGHAFEVRFWVDAEDAADAAARGYAALDAAKQRLGLGAWATVRIHAASIEERLRDRYRGLEERLGSLVECSAHVRLAAPSADGRATAGQVARLAEALPPVDREVIAERGAIEAKLWLPGRDAALASADARSLMVGAQAAAGLSDWRITRCHVCTVAEVARLHYFGVDRRHGAAPR
jgi:hypothetical protein